MISPSDILFDVKYVTYSYEEGLSHIIQIIMMVSIVALINMIVSLIIGIRKKDCLAIFVANIMVKTVAIFIYQILYDLLYLDIFFIVISTVVIEGLIYKKEMIKKSNIDLEFKTIYLEPLVILLNKKNSIDDLSIEQIQEIYYNSNSNWNTYYSKMHINNDTKIISVNNKEINEKDYPLLFEVYLIYRVDNTNENISKIVNWLETEERQEVIKNIK